MGALSDWIRRDSTSNGAKIFTGVVVAVLGAAAVAGFSRLASGDADDADPSQVQSQASEPTLATSNPTVTSPATVSVAPTPEVMSTNSEDIGVPASAPPAVPQVSLQELYVSGDGLTGFKTVNLNGVTYTDPVGWPIDGSGSADAEFDLSRRYTRLTGVLGIADDAPSDSSQRVQVIADGVEIFSVDLALGTAVPLDLDVTGTLRVKLIVTALNNRWIPRAYIGDAMVS